MATAQALSEVPDALRALLARIVARDSEALGALFNEAGGRLFALANAILRSREDAEEVVCDTFTQVWNDAHRFDPGRASVMGWLTVICRSRALDKRRQRRHPAQVVDIDSAHELEDPQPLPVDLLSLLEQGTRVRQALAELPPERRELIAMAFLEGLSHPEIAARTNLPLGTVKSHVRRSLLQLRDALQSEPV
jgi:RNA polymerase sigma-70 factor (ECF subfamily)